MLQSAVVTILLLLFATSNGLYRLPLKRYQRSVHSVAKQDGTKIPLRYTYAFGVVGEIQVGHQNDVFRVLLDTAASELILPSVNCESCGKQKAYKCVEESKFTLDVISTIGGGTGRFCIDNITIAGLTVQNQHFVVMEEEDVEKPTDNSDGVLGLGLESFLDVRQNISGYPFVPMRAIYIPTPPVINIVQQGLLSKNVFSIYYGREGSEGGEVIFGGLDTSRYTGDLSYADVIPKQSEWRVKLERFMFGSHAVAKCDAVSPCSALIDTGTPYIWIPISHGTVLMNNILHSAPSLKAPNISSTRFRKFVFVVKSHDVPNLRPLHFYIAGEKFTLEPSAYLEKIDEDLYFLKLMVSDVQNWILGETFLSSMYTVFDVDNLRIGIAPAV